MQLCFFHFNVAGLLQVADVFVVCIHVDADRAFTINHAAANPFATMLELDGATDVAGESFRAFDVAMMPLRVQLGQSWRVFPVFAGHFAQLDVGSTNDVGNLKPRGNSAAAHRTSNGLMISTVMVLRNNCSDTGIDSASKVLTAVTRHSDDGVANLERQNLYVGVITDRLIVHQWR